MSSTVPKERRIAIIGSGFSGLCLGIQLKKAGVDSFTIFEKSDRLGGTWRDNTYPGAACDIPAIAYCFSFEQKTDWSRKWALQDEILAYMDHCAEKYGLMSHIRFGCAVEGARFDAVEGVWHIRTTNGEELAEVLVSGVGQLHRPYTPDIAGLDDFGGAVFHSARWDHDVDLAGKLVAVIGNAASAIQFIPQIAPRVRQLHIFQRSANWMVPRGDRAYTEREKRLMTRFPFLAKLYRWMIWLRFELLFYPLIQGRAGAAKRAQKIFLETIRTEVADPALHDWLIPDYPIGGKRILISDDYYPSLNRDNVDLVTTGIDRFTRDGVAAKNGQIYPADVVILATGFETTSFLAPMEIEGLGGKILEREWSDGAAAYLGLTVPGFPNFFMMYGPNTNLGHNSIIFMIECQTEYILGCIRALVDGDLKYLDLREDVMRCYNERLQTDLAHTAWAATGKSWYKNSAGKITNNWSGSTQAYWWRTRRVDLADYNQVALASRVSSSENAPPLYA